MTSEYQTVRPHAVQKCAPGHANVPHWQQNRPPVGTATSLTGLYGSDVQAHTSAIIQPITVHPRNTLSRMIPAASRLSRPMMDGRKYRITRKSRVSTVHPFHFNLGAADTPARLYPTIRIPLSKCFSRLRARLFSLWEGNDFSRAVNAPPKLSSRPERPDFLLRAESWRVGPRSGGISLPPQGVGHLYPTNRPQQKLPNFPLPPLGGRGFSPGAKLLKPMGFSP